MKAVKSNFMPKPKAHTEKKNRNKKGSKSRKNERVEGLHKNFCMHQNPIIRGELRKTVINVLAFLTFISCQNEQRREKKSFSGERARHGRDTKMHSTKIITRRATSLSKRV